MKHRWEDKIENYLKEIDCEVVNRIELAQVGTQR